MTGEAGTPRPPGWSAAAIGMGGVVAGIVIGVVVVVGVGGRRAPQPADGAAGPGGYEASADVLPEPPALLSEISAPLPPPPAPPEAPAPTAAVDFTPPVELPVVEPQVPPAPDTVALAYTPPETPETEVEPESDTEILIGGPVHEALAETVPIGNPVESEVVESEEPPPAIEEVMPDDKPAGQDVAWIPGYWSWEDDRRCHIWVSGVWRRPPQNCRWVPGCWTRVSFRHYRWVSGFWMVSTGWPVQYLPPAPECPESGPVSALPGPDYIWVPGYWQRVGLSYIWQPGRWMAIQPDRVWVPAHYVWTPRGWVFIPGYWDYPLETRGVVFAPVRFRNFRAGIRYRPAIVIEWGALTVCLFSSPREHHYRFGDYFDQRYRDRGIYPWFEHQEHREKWFDPAYAHYRAAQMRDDRHWEEHLRSDYDYRFRHPETRPARTYVERPREPEPHRPADRALVPGERLQLGTRLARVVETSRAGPQKFEPVKPDRRVQFVRDQRALREYAEQRSRLEASPKTPASQARPEPKPAPVKLKPRPEPKPEPVKLQPKPEPKPEPVKFQPKPEPRPEPVKLQPRPEPKPEPVKFQPKPEPRLEPVKPQPRPEPKPEPKQEPESKPEPRPQNQAAERARQQEAVERARQQQQVAEHARQQQEAADRAKQQQEAADRARQQQQVAERARQQQEASERARQQQEAADRARQQLPSTERAREQPPATERAKEQPSADRDQSPKDAKDAKDTKDAKGATDGDGREQLRKGSKSGR